MLRNVLYTPRVCPPHVRTQKIFQPLAVFLPGPGGVWLDRGSAPPLLSPLRATELPRTPLGIRAVRRTGLRSGRRTAVRSSRRSLGGAGGRPPSSAGQRLSREDPATR